MTGDGLVLYFPMVVQRDKDRRVLKEAGVVREEIRKEP
jgi:hypothetical protein